MQKGLWRDLTSDYYVRNIPCDPCIVNSAVESGDLANAYSYSLMCIMKDLACAVVIKL